MARSRLITILLIFTVLSSIVLRPLPAYGLPNYGPGVRPGDELTYGKINVTNNTPYPIFPANLTDFKLHINTVNTQTSDVTASLVYDFQNGTQQTQPLSGNTATGTGNLFPYIVPGNLTTGESFSRPTGYPQYIFNETIQREYAGAIRTVNLLNLTTSTPGYFQKITFYWDAQTGVLLDASSRSSYNSPPPPQSFSVHFETISTNIWSAPTSPDYTFDASSTTTEIIHAGETANFQLALSSINGFTGQINITAAPTIPTNLLSPALDPSSVTLTSSTTNASAVLQVSTIATAPVGLYIISLNATSGSTTHNDFLLIAITPPDFTITVDPAILTVSEGTITTSILTVTGRGGFSGTVGIQLQFYGSQINVQLSNPLVTVNATNPTATSILTVDATFALPGTAQIDLTANSGNIYRHVFVPINVTGPDYRLTSAPASLTIRQAQSAQATIQVTSILDFKGPVDLSASSYGVSAALSAATVNLAPGGNANITLTVSAPFGVSPGQYSVYVQGQDTRGLFREIYIPVTVTGPDFTMILDNSVASLRAGQNANFTLTLSAVDRFNGTITLSSSAYGPLLTSISPSIITLDTAHTTKTAKVTVTVPPQANPSQFSEVSIQASNGNIQHYTYISINIIGPDFSITPNAYSLSLRQGESETSLLTLSSIENFTGTVNLSTSIYGPISASITPTIVTLPSGGTANANLTVQVPTTTLPGYYSINVQAVSGSLVRNAYISVIVVGPDFTVAGFPTIMAIKQGQTINATITLQSLENFTGTVKLAPGPNYPLLLSPNSTTVNLAKGSTSTVQFQFFAPQTAAPGFYNAQILATSGNLTHTVYFQVHVIGPDFSLFSSPSSLTVKQGDTAISTLFLNSIDGFAGNVTLNTNTYGLEVTPILTAVTLLADQSANTTISIHVPTTTSIGNYYITVNAFSGNIQRLTTIFVNVIGPDFSLIAFPSQLTIEAGSSAISTIQLSSLEGFSGNITLTTNSYGTNFTGAPFFATLNPATISLSPGETASAILNITTTKAAAGTNFQVFITARGANQTHYVSVFVSAIGPSFSLTSNSSFLTISNGTSATATITAASIDNFSGQVMLTVSNQFGINATLSSQNLTLVAGSTSDSVLTLKLGRSTSAGFYLVLVTGTSGNQTRSVFITVQVVTPDFIVQSNPYQLTIQAGQSALSTIQLTSINGYHGNVTLNAYFFVSGNGTTSPIRVTISPSTVNLTTGSSASAIANITATASAVGPNYVSIQATDGNLTRYTSIIVNVIGPTFSLSATQFLNVQQGETAITAVTISSIDNFTGTVDLSVLSPFGFTAALSPENVTLNAGGQADSTLTFQVQSASGGFYTLIVTGTSANITRSIYIGVNVTATGTFTITASPSFFLIPPGGTAQSIVTLHGMAGFTGTISLTAGSGTIGGPTATISPESITLNSTLTIANATVIITVPTNTTTIFDTVQVIARNGGVTQIADIGVQVKAPDFFVVADPNNIVIQPPGQQTSRISVAALGGFNGTVQLFGQASIQPGVTFNFSPANVTLSPSNIIENSTVTITVARDTAPGTWEADIFGSFAISGNSTILHFARITLTILPTPDYQILSLLKVAYLYPDSTATISSTLQSVNGFSGNVTITTVSVPTGISATPSSFVAHLASNETDQFNITIATGLNTPPGTYVLKIDATSPGILHEDQVLVIVRARPDFNISASPISVTVQASRQGTATIAFGSLNFFNGTITLSTSGAPLGVSTGVSPSSVQLPPFGNTTATLDISTTAAAKPGTYTIYITGNSSFGAHTANVTLTVTPPPDFKLSSQAAGMIIAKGSQATTLLSMLTIAGFNGTVILTTPAPQGFTTSFSVNPLSLNSPSSTVTISVASTVATGDYKLTITGTGGSFTHSVSINITVASSSTISFTVTQTQWTHRLSLSKNNNLQTFTATIKNTGSSPAYIQLLAAGNSTSSSLFFNVKTAVTMINPGQTTTITLTQRFSSSSIGQKYNLTMQLIYGTSVDQNNNILTHTISTEAQGSFTVVK